MFFFHRRFFFRLSVLLIHITFDIISSALRKKETIIMQRWMNRFVEKKRIKLKIEFINLIGWNAAVNRIRQKLTIFFKWSSSFLRTLDGGSGSELNFRGAVVRFQVRIEGSLVHNNDFWIFIVYQPRKIPFVYGSLTRLIISKSQIDISECSKLLYKQI